MKKYLAYFRTVTKANTAYRTGFFIGMFVDLVFFAVQFSVWKTVFLSSSLNQIGGYNLNDTITYYFITNLIFRFDFKNSIYMGWQIWSGYFTNDLIKPWRVIVVNIMDSLSENFISLLLAIPVTFGLYLLVREYIIFPTPQYLLLFIVTLILGFVITILFAFILNSLTFYFGDQEANIELYGAITNFLAGAVVPLTFLPSSLQRIVDFLPFKFIFFMPCQVFLQKVTQPQIYEAWAIALVWILVLIVIFRVVFMRGLKILRELADEKIF